VFANASKLNARGCEFLTLILVPAKALMVVFIALWVFSVTGSRPAASPLAESSLEASFFTHAYRTSVLVLYLMAIFEGRLNMVVKWVPVAEGVRILYLQACSMLFATSVEEVGRHRRSHIILVMFV